MNDLASFADFILKYGWLGVTIISWALFLFGVIHGDREFQREVARGDQATAQRDAAIKLAQDLTDIMEASRRGAYRKR